jgi:hypothetical protein
MNATPLPADVARRLVAAELAIDACAWHLRQMHPTQSAVAEKLFHIADQLRDINPPYTTSTDTTQPENQQ